MYNVGVLLPLTNVRAIMYYNMLRYADDVVILALTSLCAAQKCLSTFPHVLLPPSLPSTICYVARLDSTICVPDVAMCVGVWGVWLAVASRSYRHTFHGVMVDVFCIMLTV